MDRDGMSTMRNWTTDLNFRKNLIPEVIFSNLYKQPSLLDAVYGITAVWAKVKFSTISQKWRKICEQSFLQEFKKKIITVSLNEQKNSRASEILMKQISKIDFKGTHVIQLLNVLLRDQQTMDVFCQNTLGARLLLIEWPVCERFSQRFDIDFKEHSEVPNDPFPQSKKRQGCQSVHHEWCILELH
ncbi:hypothetical protein TNCV_731201 [Trichonephila clavipes]|nr:hypothetical protein TNCV_731201 [Trichonephila clavipes]